MSEPDPTATVVTSPATAATEAVTRPAADVRAAEVAAEDAAVLSAAAKREASSVLIAGQQWTSNTWESTQRQIALLTVVAAVLVTAAVAVFTVVAAVVVTAVVAIINARTGDIASAITIIVQLFSIAQACLSSLQTAMALVIGFYFARTNHQRVGGVGGDESRHNR